MTDTAGNSSGLSPTANAIIGSGHSDAFIAAPNAGNWNVTGGSGYDALILRTTPDHATVTQEQDGSVIVVLQGAVIRATRIERVEFSDRTLAVNTGGPSSPTDWNTLAAIAEDTWLATGHWFV